MTDNSFQPRAEFVTEGHFVAFPLRMPEDGLAIPPDEAYGDRLFTSRDGRYVYGTTRGRRCHCFAVMNKGAAGGVLDMGVLENARRIPALHETEVRPYRNNLSVQLLAVAEEDTGVAVWRVFSGRLSNTIQEPSYPAVKMEKVLYLADCHGVRGAMSVGADLACLCQNEWVMIDQMDGVCRRRVSLAGQTACTPPFQVDECTLAWISGEGRLGRFRPNIDTNVEYVGRSVDSVLSVSASCWRNDSSILVALTDGRLLSWNVRTGERSDRGRVSLLPVTCMSALPDGRVYGACGDGIAQFFRMDMDDSLHALGSVASVINSIRHGFEFSEALTTTEGVIYLAENDRDGHVWAYFPPLIA